MKTKFFVAAILASAMLWVGIFYFTRGVYRTGQDTGIVPNMEIKKTLNLE